MRTIKKLIMAMIVLANTGAYAQVVNLDENKLAIQGYDLVNYFAANSAVRGSSDFSTEHEGATYYFINAENMKTFTTEPSKYLPEFGGYCSFAMGKMNKKVPVDPKTFRIDDGKLYLFFNDFWEGKPFNTIVPWINNEAEMLKMAEANWKTIK